ncbi:MAG: (2Fe-2S)-binding protein [Pseudomonadota bacterium]
MSARFVRLAEADRPTVTITVDGAPVDALAGDTVLTAMMLTKGFLRYGEFDDAPRAGFCLMGACQDCWVWTPSGTKVRACSTLVAEGLTLTTRAPDGLWLARA